MLLEFAVILLGMVGSYFLKDVNFLSLQFDLLNSGVIYPDFLLIFLIYFSLIKGEFSGIWLGFFAGMLEDSTVLRFVGGPDPFVSILGLHSFAYTILGYTLGRTNRMIDKDNLSTTLIIVFVATLATRLLVWTEMGLINQFYSSYSFLSTALYTAIIAPVWFALLSWLYRIRGEKAR